MGFQKDDEGWEACRTGSGTSTGEDTLLDIPSSHPSGVRGACEGFIAMVDVQDEKRDRTISREYERGEFGERVVPDDEAVHRPLRQEGKSRIVRFCPLCSRKLAGRETFHLMHYIIFKICYI